MSGLSDKSKSICDLHDRLARAGWKREDLTIDKTKSFTGYAFCHPRHHQFILKAGLCEEPEAAAFGCVRIELSDMTIAEWVHLDNPTFVDDIMNNIKYSVEEIDSYMDEAGVDDLDDLPSENDDDTDINELL